MLLFKKLSLVAVAVVASVPMMALPTLTITDCGLNGVCGTGADDFQAVITDVTGNISFNGTIGAWDLNIVTATTKGTLGTAMDPQLSLSGRNRYSGGGTGRLEIAFTETDFTLPAGQLFLSTSGTAATTLDVFSAAIFDPTNALNGTGALVTDSTSVNFNGTAFTGLFANARTALNAYADSSYSLTTLVNLTGTNNEFVNFTADLAAVPEPGFYGALALGLSGLFAAVARRRRAAAKV